MEEVTLVADAGREIGTRPAKRLRREGKIPGVLYGHGTDPVSLAVEGRALRSALTTAAGLNALITLAVGSDRHLAMARQLQRDPVRGTVTHIDFVIVRRDEVVAAEVPINLVGDTDQVRAADGVVDQALFTLTVHATPGDIPAGIDVDVSGLTVGDAIRVGDLKLPSGVTTDVDPESPIVSATVSTVAAELEAADEAAAEAAAEAGAEEGEAASGEEETDRRDTETAEAEAGGDTSAGGEPAEG
jgi:large subunit ribosomal protein L25